MTKSTSSRYDLDADIQIDADSRHYSRPNVAFRRLARFEHECTCLVRKRVTVPFHVRVVAF